MAKRMLDNQFCREYNYHLLEDLQSVNKQFKERYCSDGI